MSHYYAFPDKEDPGRELRFYLHPEGRVSVAFFQDGVMLDFRPHSGMFDTSAVMHFEGESKADLFAVLVDLMRRHPL